MLSARPITRRVTLLLFTATTLAACGGETPTAPSSIEGRYAATTFRVTPTGAAEIDVLARGATLILTLGSSNSVSGRLTIPSLFTEQLPTNESLAGTFTRTGNTVRFVQGADTFIRDLTWTVIGPTLVADAQQVGNARFTVRLTRQ